MKAEKIPTCHILLRLPGHPVLIISQGQKVGEFLSAIHKVCIYLFLPGALQRIRKQCPHPPTPLVSPPHPPHYTPSWLKLSVVCSLTNRSDFAVMPLVRKSYIAV